MLHVNRISGSLAMELRSSTGEVILRRRARNTIQVDGARLLAELFSGMASSAINGIAVGVDNTPSGPPYEQGLTTTDIDGNPVMLNPAVAIDPKEFEVETIEAENRVRVSIRTVLPQSAAISPEDESEPDSDSNVVMIGEAALGVLSSQGDALERIYNRVVFDSIPKSSEHELAFYWEISFPFGA